jgi:hypothetical protein
MKILNEFLFEMNSLDWFLPLETQIDENQIYKGLTREEFDPTPQYGCQSIVLVFPLG